MTTEATPEALGSNDVLGPLMEEALRSEANAHVGRGLRMSTATLLADAGRVELACSSLQILLWLAADEMARLRTAVATAAHLLDEHWPPGGRDEDVLKWLDENRA